MKTELSFNNYLFRCSGLGSLMTGVKPNLTENQEKTMIDLLEKQSLGKITEKQTITLGDLLAKKHAPIDLSAGVKTYLKQLHREYIFKRSNIMKSKYTEKGIQVEDQSLTLYSNFIGKPFFKNKERFKNEYFSGEPDNKAGVIRDIKSSWDYSTFPMYDTEIKNNDYVYQLNGYMDLTGIEEAELIYCLVDTPHKIINDEIRRADWNYNVMDNDGNIREDSIHLIVEIVQNKIYTHKGLIEFCEQNPSVNIEWFTDFREIPESMRIKIFKTSKDQALIDSIKSQIDKARTYLDSLSLELANQI